MADIRFEFTINGKKVCVAGAEAFGVFSSSLTWVKRDPAEYERENSNAASDEFGSVEEWAGESVGMIANVSDAKYPGHTWFNEELTVGDEITIRILGPGEIDEPRPTLMTNA